MKARETAWYSTEMTILHVDVIMSLVFYNLATRSKTQKHIFVTPEVSSLVRVPSCVILVFSHTDSCSPESLFLSTCLSKYDRNIPCHVAQ